MKMHVLLKTFLVLLTSIPFSGNGQELSLPAPEACCSSIIVSDIDKARSWYTSTLGFELVMQSSNEDHGIAIANLKQGSMRLELIETVNSIHPDSLNITSGRLQGLFKFGVRIGKFDSWLGHLNTTFPDIATQVVTDPDTNK